ARLSGRGESRTGSAVRRGRRRGVGRLFRLPGRAQVGGAHPGVPRFPGIEGAALEFLEHDPEKPAPHLMRDGYRFWEKITRGYFEARTRVAPEPCALRI